jgi:segregation and condensation protein A
MSTSARMEFRLPQFEGPLDLLLHLVQKNEMNIHEIRIAEIADQYLSYLGLMQRLDLDVASEYLVLASTLLYLKSQSMLPSAKRARSASAEDAREELVRQLLEYKRIKEAAQFLRRSEAAREECVTRDAAAEVADGAEREYHIRATLLDLLAAFVNVLEQREDAGLDFPTEIEEEPVTVEQKMQELLLELQLRDTLTFGDVFVGIRTKLELICMFLAVLELTRLRQISVVQPEPFGAILLRLNPERPPVEASEWADTYGQDAPEAAY